MELVSIYIHIPFCIHRCSYCDFNTYTGLERSIPEYVDALCKEAEIVSMTLSGSYRIGTVYLGGGTPSLLSVRYIAHILDKLANVFNLEPDAEITMEVNPGTVTLNYLKALFDTGVNRLSIGMQSSNPFDLKFLERIHDYFDVIQTVRGSRLAGFKNINLDLIFGIPGQTIKRWQNSLELAVRLHPAHLSIYALTIEDRTPLGKWMKNGLIEEPDADLAAEMYESTMEFLSNNGYHQYEISNWAKKDAQGEIISCQHNLQYWHNLPYIGLGAGAHGYINNERVVNVRSPGNYIKRLNDVQEFDETGVSSHNDQLVSRSPASVMRVAIDKQTEMSETMIMGLRLVNQGVEKSRFLQRFGIPLEEVYGAEINKLIRWGLLEWTENWGAIKLTVKGRLLGNQVFLEFV
jgi:oxygen-independent coproporphyrinogen-3 oxidase